MEEQIVTRADDIALEGVRVNNLQNLTLKVPHEALVVICGVSGSGKSSLAFDTLYAEGQRRYVETFSPSARQFLERVERPAVDRISGLPPAVAIQQMARADSSGGTVGTRTEILDVLRMFFSRCGVPHCPDCRIPVQSSSAEELANVVSMQLAGVRLMIGVAVTKAFLPQASQPESWLKLGLTRAVVGGSIRRIEELQSLPEDESTLLIFDRLQVSPSQPERLREAIDAIYRVADQGIMLSEQAMPTSSDTSLQIDNVRWYRTGFSRHQHCSRCDRVIPRLTPEHFSFGSPLGACERCEGTGTHVTEMLTGPTASTSPRRRTETQEPQTCPGCDGTRLNAVAAAARWHQRTLPDVCAMEATELLVWFCEAWEALDENLRRSTQPAFQQAVRRLKLLLDCGLGYLSLSRSLRTLSGGEARRTTLSAALGSGLTGTLYVLDEPTQGLDSGDTHRVLSVLRQLQTLGNTVVVIEHDPVVILAADHLIELGPGAGDEGGRIVFEGSPESLLKSETLTGRALRAIVSVDGERLFPEPLMDHGQAKFATSTSPVIAQDGVAELRKRRQPEHWLRLDGVSCHNIRNLSLELPLGVLCLVTGVSGSGKSSLIADSLYPALAQSLGLKSPDRMAAGVVKALRGHDSLEQVLLMEQNPVRRSTRSIPATWLGVFDEIRILLAETHESRKRNYSRAMFSFNAAKGGRCPVCEGRGMVTVPMQFLADIETVCEECQGKRFRPEVLEVRFRDRSVDDILQMTSEQAFRFFSGHYRIQTKLNAMRQSGLGYLRLGQALSTLSGGEAQRLRIAAMLAGIPIEETDNAAGNRKPAKLMQAGRTLFLFDEPSSGLHPHDVDGLIQCLDFLLQTGHSVIVIDHHRSLIRHADWMLQMGPGPGQRGGQIMYSGPIPSGEHSAIGGQ
jgi:excinuclease ABC subunit A